MSYVRQGDIMIHSVDLGQLASDSRLGSNINHYDSMGTAATDSGEHYETLERLRNTTGCCSGQQSQRSETNTSQKTYTRYIRPCGNFPNLNGNNNSVAKTNDRVPVQLRTLKKRKGVRSRCRTRSAIFSFVGGIVVGLIIASVCWLTVDRLKESKIVCEFSEKAKDEIEEDKNDGTKTSTAVQRTQTTTPQSHVTTQDKLGKSTTSRFTSLLSKITESSTITSISTKVPKPTSLNVSSTEMSATSPTSTGRTVSAGSTAISNATGKTPILSTDKIKTISPTTSQKLSKTDTTVIVQTPTLADKNKTTDPTSQTSSIWTFSTLSNNTETMFRTSSRKVFETSTYRPTITTAANTFAQSTDPLRTQSMTTSTNSDTQSLQQATVHPNEPNSSMNVSYSSSISTSAFSTETVSSMMTSTVSATQSLQQTTVHPNESDSSNEKNVSYKSSTSTSAFPTETVSSMMTSTVSATQSLQQTTVHPNESDSSNEENVNYKSSTSTSAFSTETVSSMMRSTVSATQSLQQTTIHPNEYNSSKSVRHNSSTSSSAFSTEADSSTVHSSTLGPSSSSTLQNLPTTPRSPTTTTAATSSGSSSTLKSVPTTTPMTTAKATTPKSVSPTTGQTSTKEHDVGRRSVQGGHVYIRWGSLSCPVHAELLYKGYAAGGHWQHQGGATNTICLPEVPTWGNYSDNSDADRNLIYGTEYGSTDASFLATTGKKLRYKDVPCSVCLATGRLSHVMIPGKTECFPGWTKEYRGYLMGSGYIQNHASELICADSSTDHVTGSDAAKGGNFLYLAEVRTGSLPSPPYVNGRELACVVCTL